MYDAIIVGARCAGAPTTMLLARRGYEVLLLDRVPFPSDTMSTLYIHQPGIAALDRWGVLDRLVKTGCPRLDTVTYRLLDVELKSRAPIMPGADTAYGPRRHILDPLLTEAAVEAGAVFADRCNLSEVVIEDGRVAGVRFTTPGGRTATERARLVVGADGMNSRTAELVSAEAEVEAPRMTCVYYSCWAGVETGFGFHEGPGAWIATIPTHDDATIVSTYFPQDRFEEIRTDARAAHLGIVKTMIPELFEQLSSAEQVGRLVGTGNQRNFFRRACGAGWALVGDAGHHLDTITAMGITNAFTQAEILVESVGENLRDPRRLDLGLREFARRRDEALTGKYHSTLELARLQPSDSKRHLLRSISGRPDLTERYFAVIAGMLPMEEFLTTEVIELLD